MGEEVLHELGEKLADALPSRLLESPRIHRLEQERCAVRSMRLRRLRASGRCRRLIVARVDEVVHQRVDALAARIAQQGERRRPADRPW